MSGPIATVSLATLSKSLRLLCSLVVAVAAPGATSRASKELRLRLGRDQRSQQIYLTKIFPSKACNKNRVNSYGLKLLPYRQFPNDRSLEVCGNDAPIFLARYN